jgi:hypothetical protein
MLREHKTLVIISTILVVGLIVVGSSLFLGFRWIQNEASPSSKDVLENLPEETTAPLISDIGSIHVNETEVQITWMTDQPSTSYLAYSAADDPDTQQRYDGSYTIVHSVTLQNLHPGTTYQFRITSENRSGLSSSSDSHAFTTSLPEFESNAEFSVSDIILEPPLVEVGRLAKVTAQVSNVGGAGGSYAARLLIDGEVYDTRTLWVPAGETETVSFEIVESSEAIREIEIDGQFSTLVVRRFGRPPVYAVGDSATYDFTTPDTSITLTVAVVGTEIINGRDCYRLEANYDPPFEMKMFGATVTLNGFQWWLDQETLLDVRMEMRPNLRILMVDHKLHLVNDITHEFSEGEDLYPLYKGKRLTVVETSTPELKDVAEWIEAAFLAVTSLGGTNTYHYQVDAVEETVPAGTFETYKIIITKEDDTPVRTTWVSEELSPHEVKMILHLPIFGTGPQTMTLTEHHTAPG